MYKNRAVSLKDMKKMNKSTILKNIWHKEEISRTELAEITGLSPATISALAEELLRENIIVEVGEGKSTGGRKPIMLRVNPSGGYICAVSVLAKSITYTLFNMSLAKIEEFIVENSEEIIIQSLFENIMSNINIMMATHLVVSDKLIGIGISIPKEYDLIEKKVMFNTGVSADRMDLDNALSFQYNTPVFIEDEINSRAIAEYHLGAAKYKDEFIFIDVSEEIQATIVQNGEILKNPILQNNNIGHMIIERNGPRCICGKKGCLQVFTSLDAIVKRVKVGLIEERTTLLTNLTKGDMQKVDFTLIAYCANQGDHFIKDILQDVLADLCIGMLNFFALFSIRNIIVSGKIRKVSGLSELLKLATHKSGFSQNDGIHVMVATVPQEMVNIGNGAIVISNYFRYV